MFTIDKWSDPTLTITMPETELKTLGSELEELKALGNYTIEYRVKQRTQFCTKAGELLFLSLTV